MPQLVLLFRQCVRSGHVAPRWRCLSQRLGACHWAAKVAEEFRSAQLFGFCMVDTTVRPWHRPVAGSADSHAPFLKARDLPVAGMFGRAFVLILFAVQVALGSIVRRSKHELQVPGEKHDETVWPSSDSGGCLSYSPDGSRVPLRGTPHFSPPRLLCRAAQDSLLERGNGGSVTCRVPTLSREAV